MNIEQTIYQLGLGQPISKHKRPLLSAALIWGLTLGILLLPVGLLIVIPGLLSSDDYEKAIAQFFLYLFVLPSLALIGLSLVQIMIYRKDAQILYEHGIIDIFKGKISGIRYDYITEINQKYVETNYRGTNAFSSLALFLMILLSPQKALNVGIPIYQYRFHGKNSTTINSRIQEVGDYVKSKSFKYLFLQMYEKFNSGNRIQFGSLSIDRQGLSTPKGLLHWSDSWTIEQEVYSFNIFVKIEVDRSKRSLLQSNSIRQSINFSKISNFDIFWKLVNHLRQTHGVFQPEHLQHLLD